MEHLDVSDDDDDYEEGSQMELSNIADESFPYKSGNDSASEKLIKPLLAVAEADYVAMETSEAKECVLCKRKVCDVYIASLLTSQIKIIEGCLSNIVS